MKTAMEQGYEDAMLLLGRVYLEMEDPASARSMYQEYLQKSEQGAKAYNGLQCVIFMMVHMIAHWRISHRV